MASRSNAEARDRGTVDAKCRNARLNLPRTDARRAAFAILAAVREGQPFDRALEGALANVPDRDRRLAHEIAAGVLRHADALDQSLRPWVTRGLDRVQPPVRDLLRIGAWQLEGLDRIPAHAAVSTTVALAGDVQGRRAAGFVNAVLRRLAAAPAKSTGAVDTSGSHPRWLIDRWTERFGEPTTQGLIAWNNSRPPLVVQPARDTLAELARRFDAASIAFAAAPHDAGLIVARGDPRSLPGFDDGAFVVQDAAQALVVRFAGFPAGATIHDVCAAPGGKTVALSARAGRIIAADRSRDRAARLQGNIRRAGRGNAWVVVADAAHPPFRTCEAVLLDAPCLGTGTFARHPDARLRVTPDALKRLAGEQSVLFDAAAARIAPGGVLCYSTCSLEPEEDEQQVSAFLERHPDFDRQPVEDFPASLITARGDMLTVPPRDKMDGAFAARLVRAR